MGFPGSSTGKESPATQKTPVPFLGQGDPLEKEMATQSSILAWRIPMGRGAWRQAPLQGAGSFLGVPRLPLEKELNPVIILATSIQDTDLLGVLREKSLPQKS